LFSEVEASQFFTIRKREIQAIVESISLQQFAAEDAFCEELLNKFRIEPINLDFEKIVLSAREEQIPGVDHPRWDFLVDHMREKTFPRQVITYHIPYLGTTKLLGCIPNPRILSMPQIAVDNNEVMFDIIDFYNNAERVQGAADQILNAIKNQANYLDNNVKDYNNYLPGYIMDLMGKRKEQLKGQSRVLDALRYPLKEMVIKPEGEKHLQIMGKQKSENLTPDGDLDWDVFICHASEDKEQFVSQLALELSKRLKVWYDDFTLKIGDSLRRSIDKGLSRSRYGVVVLSHNFFDKEWPQKELDGLTAQERDGHKVILPIWLNIERDEIARYSPMLSDRVAAKASDGLSQVVSKLISVIHPPA